MGAKVWALAALAAIATTGAVLAQNAGVIEERRKLFKKIDVGADDMDDMLRAKKKFDLGYVQKALRETADDVKKLQTLFPDDSKTGNTRALPRVWEEKARFDGLMDTFARDAAAATVAVTDEKSFRATLPKLLGECKSCHDDFRARKR